jgi:hypothetical protein
MIEKDELKLIGKFFVDSGQAMVGDPCYLDGWKTWDSTSGIPFEEHKNSSGEYGYLGAANATLTKEGYGTLGHRVIEDTGLIGTNAGSAVVFSTGYGDGVYSVYATTDDDGRIAMVVIDFMNEIEDN